MTDGLPPTQLPTLLNHAHNYARAGLEVFPVNPEDKTPLKSQYEATTDLDQIEAWWKRWPEALIGHRISPDFVLLDIDPRHKGDVTWRAMRQHMPGLETRLHYSGRGDGGGHVWLRRPAERLSVSGIDAWAKEHGGGHQLDNGRWTGGIDVLRHDHRYTILPPSPHVTTGKPYFWADGRDLDADVAPMPTFLADLLVVEDVPQDLSRPMQRDSNPATSIADWYSENASWVDLLGRHGWRLVAGNGDEDGSRWRHPAATSAYSATIRYGLLFVYSPNTAFEPTSPGDVHGYTRFAALAVLEHHGNQSDAGRAARAIKGPDVAPAPKPERIVDPETGEILEAPSPVDRTATPMDAVRPTSSRPFQRAKLDVTVKPEPRPTLGRYCYVGGMTALQSEPGVGKTWLAVHLALEAIMAGGTALYFDEEGGEDLMRERLYALGAPQHLIEERFWYFPFEARQWNEDDLLALEEIIREAATGEGSVAIFDSLPDFLAAAGLSEDKAQDVTQFVNTVLRKCREARLSQVVLDHLVKPQTDNGRKTKSRYSRGSGAKLGKADATFLLEVARPFDTRTSGQLRAWKTKDRYGRLDVPRLDEPALLIDVTVSGDGRVQLRELEAADAPTWSGPTECMEAIERLLSRPGIGELSQVAIEKQISNRRDVVREALRWLVELGRIELRTGPRNALLYSLPEFVEGVQDDLF